MAQDRSAFDDALLSTIHEEDESLVNNDHVNNSDTSPWQIILYDNDAGKLVLYNNESKEVEVFVSSSEKRHSSTTTTTTATTTTTTPQSQTTQETTSLELCDSVSSSDAVYADPAYFDLLHDILEAEQSRALPPSPLTTESTSQSQSVSSTLPHNSATKLPPSDEKSVEHVRHQHRTSSEERDSVSSSLPTAPNGTPLLYTPSTSPPPTSTKLSAALNSGYYRRFFVEERRLGTGGYGAVFLVRHRINSIDLGTYALKKVPVGEDEEWLQRVLKEVKALETLCKHPNIINYKHAWLECDQIADFGPLVPCLYILMEFANGGNLWDYVLQHSPLSESLVWSFFLDIVLGLECLHSLDIVHHDLKAQNLLLHYTDPQRRTTPHLLISDFGTCEMLKKKTSLHSHGHTGSLEWMPPEAIRVETNESGEDENEQHNAPPGACDIWALGLVLYFMTFAQLPYTHTSCERILDAKALAHEIRTFTKITFPSRDPPVSSALLEMIEWLLQPNPRLRPSVHEVLQKPIIQQHLSQRNLRIPLNNLVSPPPPITTTPHHSLCGQSSSLTSASRSQSHSLPPSPSSLMSGRSLRRPQLSLPRSRLIRVPRPLPRPFRRQPSTELLKNIPPSFIVPSPPPSLQNTPEASLEDLSAYFRLMSKSSLLNAIHQTPPFWLQCLHLILFIAKVSLSLFGCGSNESASNIHAIGLATAAAFTFLLVSSRQCKIMQVVLTCGQWLWTTWYVLTGRLCTFPLSAATTLSLLFLCTLLYTFSLTLIFVNDRFIFNVKIPFNFQTLHHELWQRLKKMQ